MGDMNDLNNKEVADSKSAAVKDGFDKMALSERLAKVEEALQTQATERGAKSKDEQAQKELLDRVKVGERWMIGLTALIFIVSAFQAYETWSNNESTGRQTDQIIIAAKMNAHSADHNASAAQSFADSASGINQGVTKAVDSLSVQAKQAEILANNSKKTLDQVKNQFVEDQRPLLWIEDDKTKAPYVETGTINAGKLLMEVYFKNFGKSPAVGVLSWGYISANTDDPANDVDWREFPHSGEGIYAPNGVFNKTVRSVYVGDFRDILQNGPPSTKPRYAFHVLVRYADLYGNKYESQVCRILQPNDMAEKCKNNNYFR